MLTNLLTFVQLWEENNGNQGNDAQQANEDECEFQVDESACAHVARSCEIVMLRNNSIIPMQSNSIPNDGRETTLNF